MNGEETCHCQDASFSGRSRKIRVVGIDRENGRFGEVSIETCSDCERRWLKYAVAYEAFSGSGRWYRGQIAKSVAERIRAEDAVTTLEALDWFFFGGSYFKTSGKRGSGKLDVDLGG